jgi:hypothetical protein
MKNSAMVCCSRRAIFSACSPSSKKPRRLFRQLVDQQQVLGAAPQMLFALAALDV